MAILPAGPARYIGDHSSLSTLPDVLDVFKRLDLATIDLTPFGYTITSVTTRKGWPSRPYGFDFKCYDVEGLTKVMESLTKQLPKSANDFSTPQKPTFNEDKSNTAEGAFSLGDTTGRGWRQIGDTNVLHVELALNGKCNIHVDSHGYVTGPDDYDWGVNALLHGYWDLLSDKISPLYGGIGSDGKVGPMAFRPILGLDGVVGWYFGVTGYF